MEVASALPLRAPPQDHLDELAFTAEAVSILLRTAQVLRTQLLLPTICGALPWSVLKAAIKSA